MEQTVDRTRGSALVLKKWGGARATGGRQEKAAELRLSPQGSSIPRLPNWDASARNPSIDAGVES